MKLTYFAAADIRQNIQYFAENLIFFQFVLAERRMKLHKTSNQQPSLIYWHLHRTHTHTRLTALFLGLSRSASTRKVKPIRILLKQQTVSGSGISWAICKSAPRSRQITTPAPHHSVFYRLDALPAAQPTVSKALKASS